MAPRPVGLEARALLVGIGQLDERIGQFDAADEQLEPLGNARIGRIAARQRGLRGGPVGEEGGMRAAELWLDPLEQEAEEQVLPVLVRAQRCPRRGRECRGVLGRGQHIDATYRANASATVRRSIRDRSVVTPRQVTTGGMTARRYAVVSSISEAMSAPGRYHSSMVNSGAWRSLPSPFRHTRANWKIGPAPATSSFFMASSGLVCSQSGWSMPSGCSRSVRKARRWTSSPGVRTA